MGQVLIEGKTKIIHEIKDSVGHVLIQSKDRITAGDGARADVMEGKAVISTATNCNIFDILNTAGEKVSNYYILKNSREDFDLCYQQIPVLLIPLSA